MPDDLPTTRQSEPSQVQAPAVTGTRSPDPTATTGAPAGLATDHLARDFANSGLPLVPGYEVLHEIARGGMGRVFAARDLSLDRPVAIKTLLPGASAGDLARRFVTESKVTAQLPHPNIPPVYALGTLGDGAPFLAMKLIEGHTLAALLKDRSSPADDLPRFVRAFEQVCLAVGFAHAQGIIHRDLKPANVMVGAFGEVQVMDWGLARAVRDEGGKMNDEMKTGETSGSDPSFLAHPSLFLETQAGQVMGTPAYMAPEQARGEAIDSRVDVFALGAILCETLTGVRAFVGNTSPEVIARAAAGDTAKALASLSACGADAELIALAKRCLEPLAADRPANGKAIADAVAAHRASVETRLRTAERERAATEAKAVEQRKRRRVQMALAGAVTLMLFGAGAFGWWDDRQAAERKAATERTEREKQEAELRQQGKDNAAAGENRTAMADLIKRCEDGLGADNEAAATAALVEIDRRASRPGAEEFRDRIARCRANLTMLARLNGIDDQRWTPVRGHVQLPSISVPHWAKAFEDYGIVPGKTPPAEVARLLARSPLRERVLAGLELWHLFGNAPGLTEILHELDPDPVRDAIRAEVQRGDWDRVRSLVQELADGPAERNQPTRFVAALGVAPEIPSALRRALLKQAVVHAPHDFAVLMGLGAPARGDHPSTAGERVRWYQSAVAVRPRAFIPRISLGIALWAQGNRPEGLQAFREATNLGPTSVWTHYNLGKALSESGDLDGALVALREAIRLDPNEPWIHNELGNVLWTNRDLDGALVAFREAIRLNPDLAEARYNLGGVLRANRDIKGAMAEFREALRIEPMKADALNALGNALWDTNDLKGAEDCFRKAIAANTDFVSAHYNLGILLRQKNDLPGAIAAYREVIRIDPKHVRGHYGLGLALRANGDVDGAIAAYRKLLAMEPNHAPGHNGLGNALKEKDDLDGAIAAYREAVRIDPNNSAMRTNLANTLRDKTERDAKTAPPPREVKKP